MASGQGPKEGQCETIKEKAHLGEEGKERRSEESLRTDDIGTLQPESGAGTFLGRNAWRLGWVKRLLCNPRPEAHRRHH